MCVSSRMRSASVDLPWSMWAMIEKLRISSMWVSRIGEDRRRYPAEPRELARARAPRSGCASSTRSGEDDRRVDGQARRPTAATTSDDLVQQRCRQRRRRAPPARRAPPPPAAPRRAAIRVPASSVRASVEPAQPPAQHERQRHGRDQRDDRGGERDAADPHRLVEQRVEAGVHAQVARARSGSASTGAGG